VLYAGRKGLCVGWGPWPLNCRGIGAATSGRPSGGTGPRLAAASYKPAGRPVGTCFIAPVRNEARRCIAMMNSVTPNAPRCSVSARFHMRPSVSLGNLAFSKICFAFSPTSLGQRSCVRSMCTWLTGKKAINCARFLEQASILGGFGGQQRRHADRASAHLWSETSSRRLRENWRRCGCSGNGQPFKLG